MIDEKYIDKFHNSVSVRSGDECWEWARARTPAGYGVINIGGKTEYAHRIAWELANNRDVPDGMLIRHKCDNPSCCNPAHLEIGTSVDNARDSKERGREARGKAVWSAKLTESDVIEIRRLLSCGVSQGAIAKRFEIYPSTVSDISTGTTWGWMGDIVQEEEE